MGNRKDAARRQLNQRLDELPPNRSTVERPSVVEEALQVIAELRAEIWRSVRKALESPGK